MLGERLTIGTAAEADIQVLEHELPPGEAANPPVGEVGAIVLRDGAYEVESFPGAGIWINGERVQRRALVSGDLLEIGEGGPVLRFRLYKPGSPAHKSMAEAFADCRDCARHGGKNPLHRAGILLARAPTELATQTSLLWRAGLAAVLIVLLGVIGFQTWRNLRLEGRLAEERARVEGLAVLLAQAEQSSFNAQDVAAARRIFEQRLSDSLARIEALESRAVSREKVISTATRSVVFLQGAYGFIDENSGRPLRYVGDPSVEDAEFGITLEGDGPVVEILYTGTGFVATADGLLLTNRHVALPWEYDPPARVMAEQGLTPVMRRFRGYLPGVETFFDVALVRPSDNADVAVLRCELVTRPIPPLALSDAPPRAGEEVIVLGYPTGMHALLARIEPAVAESLMASGPLDFWKLAEDLSSGGHIAPLATVGIVGQVTSGSVVYDAETTHGGSGGPVLNLDGEVVAVNAAIIPEFGGSNLGVPAAEAIRLLALPDSP